MKVLHLISGGDTGGAKTHVFALLDALKSMAQVKIVCLTAGVFYQEIRQRDVPAVLLEQKNRLDLSVVQKLQTIIQEEGFQILHVHGARANFIAKHLKKKMHIPVVTTVHSDYLLDFDGFYRKLVYTSLNMAALKKMDYYIGVSSNFRQMLISRGFRPNSVFTVYNGMDYREPPVFAEKAEFAARIGIEYDPSLLYVGLIGRHDFVKGHDVFIRAAAIAAKARPNLRFVIAGDGEGREALVRLAQTEGISDKLFFAGFIRDIYSFIHFIDINTLSSRSESFPYVLLEGARMKKPTISAAVGGIPDLITENQTGLLFPSEDSRAFADQIIRLADDAALRERLGSALYTRATENFSSESLAKTHIHIYESILRDWQDSKRYDVVFSGYYGYHNSGDDALLKAMLESLRREMPFLRPLVFSAKPKETKKLYGVDAAYRFHPLKMRRILKNAHMLLNGGGSLLQDVTSKQSLWYYLWVMRLARKCGAKLYIYANGIGPLHGRNCFRAARAVEAADMITLRDTDSLKTLQAMGVRNPHILVTADPAFSLSGVGKEAAETLLRKEGIPAGKRYLGIALLEGTACGNKTVEQIAPAIDYAVQKYDLVPLFIPMRKKTDMGVAARLETALQTKLHVLAGNYKVEEMIGLVQSCTLLVGMRLHALIYAVSGGVPVIGLSYDPKVNGFLEYIGQDYVCDIKEIDTDKLSGYMDEICTACAQKRAALTARADDLREKAEENARIAVQLLQEK